MSSPPQTGKDTGSNHRTAILVLGMHRSGTSAFTRALNLLGAEIPGRLMMPNSANPKGYWECQELVDLHEELLASAGSGWDDISPFPVAWFESGAAAGFRVRTLEILERNVGSAPLFVLKDPRMCRLVPFWLAVLKEFRTVPRVLIPLRNPLEVAASLKARDEFLPAKSLLLWLRNFLDAEHATREVVRSFVTYDALLENWRGTVDKIRRDLQISFPVGSQQTAAEIEIEAFLSSADRHHAIGLNALEDHPAVVRWVRSAYSAASATTTNGRQEAAVFDQVRNELNEADTLFGPVVADGLVRLDAAANQLRDLDQTVQQRDRQIDALHAELGGIQAQLAHLQGELRRRDGQIDALHVQLAGVQSQCTQLQGGLEERDRRIDEVHAELTAVYASRSWRVTHPLRVFKTRVRRWGPWLRRPWLWPMVVLLFFLPASLRGRLHARAQHPGPLAYVHVALLHPLQGLRTAWKGLGILHREGWAGVEARLRPDAPSRRHIHDLRRIRNGLRAFPTLAALPWRFAGSRPDAGAVRTLLLTSHDASRTGAPTVVLGLVAELALRPDHRCWVLLNTGGPLEADFAQHAPTLNLERLLEQGLSRQDALDWVAWLFKAHAPSGVALCNTAATPDINATLARSGVSVVSWIHELPNSIDTHYGGQATFDTIFNVSKCIICPSEFTRERLIWRYRPADPQRLVVWRYGHSRPTQIDARGQKRLAVRSQLGIPQDAVVVLGCGTAHLRKGADLFTQIAMQVLRGVTEPQVWFVWVGRPHDVVVAPWAHHNAVNDGLAGRIQFVDECSDVQSYYAAADILALPSREDPFPLVNMEAMVAELPVVAFEGAGGAPEVLRDGCGVVVPYLDVSEFAEAVVDLIRRPQERAAIGARASAAMRAPLFHWNAFADRLDMLLPPPVATVSRAQQPSVSVVLVCFEHAHYIEQRLEGILNQTVPPREIIFLDDASRDASVSKAQRLAMATDIPVRFIVNRENSGSPFLQWRRGVEAACSELVWVAEGDDFCDPRFLEALLPAFADPEVVLAYSQSAPVGGQGQVYQPDYRSYTAELSTTRWDTAYTNDGNAELSEFLCVKNTIPNASAVLFRRSALLPWPEEADSFRFTGDWFIYAHVLRQGKIAFVPLVLNFHRRHSGTVTHSVERENQAIVEQLRVKTWIMERVNVPLSLRAFAAAQTVSDYHRLAELHGLTRVPFVENPALRPWVERLRELCAPPLATPERGRPHTLLIVIGDSEVGGGQLAAIRLGNELAKHHHVFLCSARPEVSDSAMLGHVSARVLLLEGTLGVTEWSVQSRPPEQQSRRVAESARRIAVLRDLLQLHRVESIMSHIWWADRFTLAMNREPRLPWYVQMHGCYEGLAEHPDWDPEFDTLSREIMERVAGVCYSTARNLRVFELGILPRPGRIQQFFNALDPAVVPTAPDESAAARQPGEFVFCLCSRAIPEKGWEEAITATLQINALPPERRAGLQARLLLIGDSEYGRSLSARYAARPAIRFLGRIEQPMGTILACDVGLLPTRFLSESVPSTVIEYLACGKPVVATTNASIPEMVTWNGRDAALLVPHDLPQAQFERALREAMLRYMTDAALREEHQRNARPIFDAHFSARQVAAQYDAFLFGLQGETGVRIESSSSPLDGIEAIRVRLKNMGSHSHTSAAFQDAILNFVVAHADKGGCVVEVGCYRGGLTAQLAHVCTHLGKLLYVIDIDKGYLEVAKGSVRASTRDAHVHYHCGDLTSFVTQGIGTQPAILMFVDGDHRYEGVVKDVAAIWSMERQPYAAAFHDFSLRYATKGYQDVRVDKGILDSLAPGVHYQALGEIAGNGPTLRTTPGEDGHYHQLGEPEGVLLICGESSLRTSGTATRPAEPSVCGSAPLEEAADQARDSLEVLFSDIRRNDWSAESVTAPPLGSVPTMLSMGEQRMLRHIAATYPVHPGHLIIDAGCFLGGSTYALASGLAINPQVQDRAKVLHSYDIFITPREQYPKEMIGPGYNEGSSFYPEFVSHTSKFGELIQAHIGDFCLVEPPEEGIDILFIDIAKTWELNFRAMQFFAKLVPGKSIVIQQDHNDHSCPWIAVTMAHLRDYFDVLTDEGASRVYGYKKQIPDETLRANPHTALSAEQQLRLMEYAIESSRHIDARYLLLVAKGWLLFEHSGGPAALQYLERLDEEHFPQPWETDVPYRQMVMNMIRQFHDESSKRQYYRDLFSPSERSDAAAS